MYYEFFGRILISLEEKSPGFFSSLDAVFGLHRHQNVGDSKLDIRVIEVDKIIHGTLIYVGDEAVYDESHFYLLDSRGSMMRTDFESEILVERRFSWPFFCQHLVSCVLFRLVSAGVLPVHASSVSHAMRRVEASPAAQQTIKRIERQIERKR